jgi:CRISPR-associated endonuclease Cas1
MTIWFPFRHLFGRQPPVASWPPPALPEEVAEPGRTFSPTAAPVHVMSGGALARVSESTLVIERKEGPTFERPIELVSALHIHGWSGVTSPCVGQLVAQGTPVVWRGLHGFPIGIAVPMHAAGLDVRRAQYAQADGERGLDVARRLVEAKIVNMRGLVRRRAGLGGSPQLKSLAALARRARSAGALDTLLGLEGSATALYFSLWNDMLADRAGDIEFEGRSRRPPQDAVNAMLSYAYAVLAGECLCAVAATGLDPRLGVLHQPRAGRAALALDLMEPFRPDAGVLLTESGKRTLLDLIEKRLTASFSQPDESEPITNRDAICRQAGAIAATLLTGAKFQGVVRP